MDTKSIHRFFGLPEDKTGILITNVFDYSVSKGILKKHDIITHIDGNQIMNDGTTKFRENETIAMEHLISLKYDQETIDITIWRDKQEIQLKDIKLSISPSGQRNCHLVPIHEYDKNSSYFIFGGCIFTILTQPFLHTWGDDWYHYAPRDLINEAMKGHLPCPPINNDNNDNNDNDDGHGIEEFIVLSSVRPHHTNMGCGKYTNIILEKVGNTKIKSLKHLKQVIENDFILNMDKNNNLIDFHFRKDALMVLDIKQSILAETDIMQRNRIPYRQSFDLDEFDNVEVEQLIEKINKEKTSSLDINYDSITSSSSSSIIDNKNNNDPMDDESIIHDIGDDDHSKLLSQEQTNVETEKYKKS